MSGPGSASASRGRAAHGGSPTRLVLASGLLFLGIGDLAAIDLVLVPRYVADGASRGDVARGRRASEQSHPSATTSVRPGGEDSHVQAVDTGPAAIPAPAAGSEGAAGPIAASPSASGLPTAPAASIPPEDFPDLLFAINTSWLSRPSRQTLDGVADALTSNPDHRVILGGHTDDAGDPDFNRALSRERAQRAARYLRARGVDLSRIEIQAFGSERPVEAGPSAAPRARNRRVEISVQ